MKRKYAPRIDGPTTWVKNIVERNPIAVSHSGVDAHDTGEIPRRAKHGQWLDRERPYWLSTVRGFQGRLPRPGKVNGSTKSGHDHVTGLTALNEGRDNVIAERCKCIILLSALSGEVRKQYHWR